MTETPAAATDPIAAIEPGVLDRARFKLTKEAWLKGNVLAPAGKEIGYHDFNGKKPGSYMEPVNDEARQVFAAAFPHGIRKDPLRHLMETDVFGNPTRQMAREQMAVAERMAAKLVEGMAPAIAGAIAGHLSAAGLMARPDKGASPEDIAKLVAEALNKNAAAGGVAVDEAMVRRVVAETLAVQVVKSEPLPDAPGTEGGDAAKPKRGSAR